MRINLPDHLQGKELFQYLIANKASLIAKKKMLPIKSDPLACDVTTIETVKEGGAKADGNAPMPDVSTLHVKVVANCAWWSDSYQDVLTGDCYTKTVKEKGASLPHIKDHVYSSTGHVGDVLSVYTQNMTWKSLNVPIPGSTTVVVWETNIQKQYDEKVFLFYRNGKIKQHSIGLYYVKIELAINDADYKEEFAVWNANIDKIGNKEKVMADGYFWLVSEIKLIENSCVLFGACELTPTLEVTDGKKSTEQQPEPTTAEQPPVKTAINFSLLLN